MGANDHLPQQSTLWAPYSQVVQDVHELQGAEKVVVGIVVVVVVVVDIVVEVVVSSKKQF